MGALRRRLRFVQPLGAVVGTRAGEARFSHRAAATCHQWMKANKSIRAKAAELFQSHEPCRIGAGNLSHFLYAQAAFVQHAEIHAE